MGIEIREVVTNRELKKFVRFRFQLCQRRPRWAPGLDSDETDTLWRGNNPAFAYRETRH